MRRHDPEGEAARYVSASLRRSRAARFEAHLVTCEECWTEVRDSRLGRTLAEAGRELAPQRLREAVRAQVAALDPPARARHRALIPGIVATVAVAVLGVFILMPNGQPALIAAAVDDFEHGKMVTDEDPHATPPDLSQTTFALSYTGRGFVGGQMVDAFLYKAPDGDRLLVYMSDEPFPVARGASQVHPGEPWRAEIEGVALLCTARPHAMLVVADDASDLDSVASALHIDA